MRRRWLLLAAKWGLGPLAVGAVAGALGQLQAGAQRGKLVAATAAMPEAERQALESVPMLAAANATWAFGSVASVKKMVRSELDRLSVSDGPASARVLLRFGIVDDNPEGQAAVFAQACAADPTICDRLRDATEAETKLRAVSPGNRLPLYFLGGHPPISPP